MSSSRLSAHGNPYVVTNARMTDEAKGKIQTILSEFQKFVENQTMPQHLQNSIVTEAQDIARMASDEQRHADMRTKLEMYHTLAHRLITDIEKIGQVK